MDNKSHLEIMLYVGLSLIFLGVIVYWILYTRRLKTPRNAGKEEGIAAATQLKERAGKTGRI